MIEIEINIEIETEIEIEIEIEIKNELFGYQGTEFIMVLTLDGNSEIGAHVRSNLCYLICLRHLII